MYTKVYTRVATRIIFSRLKTFQDTKKYREVITRNVDDPNEFWRRKRRCTCNPCLIKDVVQRPGAGCLVTEDVGVFEKMEVTEITSSGKTAKVTRSGKGLRKKDDFLAFQRDDVSKRTKRFKAMPYYIARVIQGPQTADSSPGTGTTNRKNYQGHELKAGEWFIKCKTAYIYA